MALLKLSHWATFGKTLTGKAVISETSLRAVKKSQASGSRKTMASKIMMSSHRRVLARCFLLAVLAGRFSLISVCCATVPILVSSFLINLVVDPCCAGAEDEQGDH